MERCTYLQQAGYKKMQTCKSVIQILKRITTNNSSHKILMLISGRIFTLLEANFWF